MAGTRGMDRERSDWITVSGSRVAVHALNGSEAAARAQAELREAEQAIVALEHLLRPEKPRRGARLDVYLVAPGNELSAEATTEPGETSQPERYPPVTRVIPSAESNGTISRDVTRLVVPFWFGANAATAAVILDGLAGYIAAQIGAGPPLTELDAEVRAELAASSHVSLFDEPDGTPAAESASFVNYLIESFGADALVRLLRDYDPSRRDRAAIEAYQRPLGALEESWLSTLSRTPDRAAFRAFFHYIAPLLKPYWRREIEVFAYMLYEMAWGVVLPLSMKYLIDTVIPQGSTRKLFVFILVLLALYGLDAAIGLRRSYVNNWINSRVLMELQQKMYAHLQELSHSFYARSKVGDLLSRLSIDLQVVDQALAQVAGVGVFMALRAIAAAVTIVVLSPLLGALVLVVVPLFAVVYFTLRTRLQSASIELQKLIGEATSAAQENLSAHAVIKAFGLELYSAESYRARLQAIFRVTMRLVLVASLFETSMGLATTLGQLVVLGVGGYLIITGSLSIGTLVAFTALLPSLFSPVAALANVGQSMEKATGALDRVTAVLREPVGVADKPEAVALEPLTQAIQVKDVTFGYEPGQQVLKNLDLTIPAGAHVAIVGPSGCGKSSIVNLLLRFWDPNEGQVRFDGRDARDVTLESLRGQVGLVFQDTFVFDTTLRENIAIGRIDASDEEVRAAAVAAELDSYIASLPAGYDTMLGERGVRMSGGQRQRLAIARALVRDPQILILDEATSALDPETEAEILATIQRLAESRTTISITHRLTTAAGSDRIFVIEGGRVVEEGSHAELVHAGGLYQHLYEEQTRHAAAAADSPAVMAVAGSSD